MNQSIIRRTIVASLGLAGALGSSLAWAHIGANGEAHAHDLNALGSFIEGAVHPLTGLDHLAAMVSVGLWSVLGARRESWQSSTRRSVADQDASRPAVWPAPVAFALILLVGALLGMSGLSLPGVEPMIAASLLILGLLVATRTASASLLAVPLVAGFALFHGVAHGQELSGHAAAALAGMVMTTALLHVAGMIAGLALRDARHPARRWASRLTGGAVALLGMSLLAPALAQAWA